MMFLPQHTISRSTLQAGRGTMTWSKFSKGFMLLSTTDQTMLAAEVNHANHSSLPFARHDTFRRAFVRESSLRGGRRTQGRLFPQHFFSVVNVLVGTRVLLLPFCYVAK